MLIHTFDEMKKLDHQLTSVFTMLCGSLLMVSCNKGLSSPSTCTDLMVQHFDPPHILFVPCVNMYVDSVAVDSIDVDGDAIADLRISYSAYVVFPGGGGSSWMCYGEGIVSGLDSTEIVYHSTCSGNCQGPLQPTDSVKPDDPTTSWAQLHTYNVLACNCFRSPGSIGFIKHIDGHSHCGYVEVRDSTGGINVFRTVFGNCPDKIVVVQE